MQFKRPKTQRQCQSKVFYNGTTNIKLYDVYDNYRFLFPCMQKRYVLYCV